MMTFDGIPDPPRAARALRVWQNAGPRLGIFGTTPLLSVIGLLLLCCPARPAQAQVAGDASHPPTAEQAVPAETKRPNIIDYTRISGSIANARLPQELPEVLWKFTSGVALTDTVVADGKVYFGDDTGRIFALDARTGDELWRHQHVSRIAAQPAVDQDYVYFGSNEGVTAIRRDTGERTWHHAIGSGAGEATPIPVGERVFASGYDGHAYALNRTTGEVLWKHDFISDAPPDEPGFAGDRARIGNAAARPNGSACDGDLFVQNVFDQSRTIALDCQTGERRWTFQAHGWLSPPPTIINERVFIASQDKHVYCLERQSGQLLWKFQAPTWLASRVAVHEERVFVPSHRGLLHQLSAQSGETIQTFQAPDLKDRASTTYSFPIIANDTVYFAMGSGGLYAIGIEKNDLKWSLRAVENAEIFSNLATDGRRIFVTTRQGLKREGEFAIVAIGAKQ